MNMTTASEDFGQSLGQVVGLIFQTILPKGRYAAEGVILLLIMGVAVFVTNETHSLRLEWWDFLAFLWWQAAQFQLWASLLSAAFIVGFIMLAWIDFAQLDPRGPWPFFYLFTAACWLVGLIWLWNGWPEEDSFEMHFTFAFLLYAATASTYVALTLFLKRLLLSAGAGLRDVAAQQAHGDARAATEAEAAATLRAGKGKQKPRNFGN
jgi:hypothetical protein